MRFWRRRVPAPPAVSWDSFQAALDMMERVYRYGGGMADEYSYRDVLGLFNEGKSAMYINGVWANPMIEEQLNVRYAAFPYQNGDTVSCVSACLGYLVGNTKDEKKIEASVRFVKYMVSEPVQKRILLETQQMPSNPDIRLEDFRNQMPRFYQAAGEVLQSKQKLEVPDNVWGGKKIIILKEKIMGLMDGTYPRRDLFEQIK